VARRGLRRIDGVDRLIERPVLAVDLGGTQIRAALITPDRSVHCRRAEPTRDDEGEAAVIDRICELLAAVRDEAAEAELPAPIGAGIAAPGPLDPHRGVVLNPPNLRGWNEVPLADLVGRRVELPTILERDTNVAVMAEWRYGAARGTSDAVYVTVSTGIGGGIVSGGRPLTGRDGFAGEVGHLVVDIDGPVCGCGGIGHVEAIASGTAIEREARALLLAARAPGLARLVADGTTVDTELVAHAAANGDAEADALLMRAWVAIGALCASLVNLLDPEVIVIGGGIAEHQPRLFDVARRELDRRVLPALAGRTRIAPAALGGDVSLVGLLPIVNDRIGDPAHWTGSHTSRTATASQGAPTS
jgi:glucokinase